MRKLAILFGLVLLVMCNHSAYASGEVNGVWTLENSPYLIGENSYVPQGDTLTIEAGVDVIFAPVTNLRVFGQLLINGTEKDPVNMTCSDTESIWGGILIETDDPSIEHVLTYLNIDHAYRGIETVRATVLAENVSINASWAAIQIQEESQVSFDHSSFEVVSPFTGAHTVDVLNSMIVLNNCDVNFTVTEIDVHSDAKAMVLNNASGEIDSTQVTMVTRSGGPAIDLNFCNDMVEFGRVIVRNMRYGDAAHWNTVGIRVSSTSLLLDHANIVLDTDDGTAIGLYVTYSAEVEITNSIISAVDNGASVNRLAVYVDQFSEQAQADMSYSCVSNMDIPEDMTGFSYDPETIVQADPEWIAPDAGDYHLLETSPCINAGDPDSALDPDGTLPDIGYHYYEIITEAPEPGFSVTPGEFTLSPPYPNPFNSTVRLQIAVPNRERVVVSVYDILGRQVATVTDEVLPAGLHIAAWQPENNSVASGVYVIRGRAGNQIMQQRAVLVR